MLAFQKKNTSRRSVDLALWPAVLIEEGLELPICTLFQLGLAWRGIAVRGIAVRGIANADTCVIMLNHGDFIRTLSQECFTRLMYSGRFSPGCFALDETRSTRIFDKVTLLSARAFDNVIDLPERCVTNGASCTDP